MGNDKLAKISTDTGLEAFQNFFDQDKAQTEHNRLIAQHRAWLKTVKKEVPNPKVHYRVGIYIRYYNQTKYDNYLYYHKKLFEDSMALCPNWKLVDYYIDEGSTAPNMETAPEWSRLLQDCMDGKVDLIITQKVSNVSQKVYEVTYCARILAALKPPVGIYFLSENIFTLASYYTEDLHNYEYLPDKDWKILAPTEEEIQSLPPERQKRLLELEKGDNDA